MSYSRNSRARRATIGVRRFSGRAGDAQRGDDLLGLPVAERGARGEVAAGDVVGVLLGDLLDVDPAHVGEEHHGALAGAVPDDAGVVLVGDVGAVVHEHAAGHVTVDLQVQDVLGVARRVLRGVREPHAAGLHPAAGQDLGLDHDRTGDLLGDPPRLVGRLGEPVLRDRDPGLGHDRPRFVFEETHLGRGNVAVRASPWRAVSHTSTSVYHSRGFTIPRYLGRCGVVKARRAGAAGRRPARQIRCQTSGCATA